jgi:serine/threonine-protein kinase
MGLVSREVPMNEPPPDSSAQSGQTVAQRADDRPPLVAADSVLFTLSDSLLTVPRVVLRDPAGDPVTPILCASTGALPDRQDPAARLQLRGEIARGGMGAVLRGRDTDLGRDIAVKVLLEKHQGESALVQRFIEEAQISGQLQHPGVVPIYELGRLPDRRLYFTMKLVKGRTLAQLLAERPRPDADWPHLLPIFGQACQTLAYAHARGVIHRDLKPSNIMVGAFGEVQVMDWGLAKVLAPDGEGELRAVQTRGDSMIRTARQVLTDPTDCPGALTQVGSVLGTPAYMAPEQARGDVDLVDERVDVFGLGAILCEILTGQPPFTGKVSEAQRKAQTARLEDATARLDASGADPTLVALTKWCLAAEPWDRPRDARQVAQAMTDFQESADQRLRQAELERAAASARALEERKRRRVAVALAASLLALALVGGGVGTWWFIERRATEQEVQAALDEAAKQRDGGHGPEARAAVERAAGRLGSWGLTDLHKRIERARLDAELVAALDEIRLASSDPRTRRSTSADLRSDAAYRKAFARYGIGTDGLTRSPAEAVVGQSPIRMEILAGLYDWLRVTPEGRRDSLRALLESVDDDAWRRSFRVAVLAPDLARLKALANQAETLLSQPPTVQFWLAEKLRTLGGIKEAETLLRQSQRQKPGDFWLNYQLGTTLLSGEQTSVRPGEKSRAGEAVRYFLAAVALRPTSAAAHHRLGVALSRTGDSEGAAAEYRQAMALDPDFASPGDSQGGVIGEHRLRRP